MGSGASPVMGDTSTTSIIWEGVVGAAIQAGLVVLGGVWALHHYIRGREYKPHVRVGVSARLSPGKGDRPARLFVRVHIVNESSARCEVNAAVTLWEVAADANSFPTFNQITNRDFPFDYVHGEVEESGFMTGPRGQPVTGHWLEPTECVESEVLFSPEPCPELMAIRASSEKEVRRRKWTKPWDTVGSGLILWEVFAYVDPEVVSGSEYVCALIARGFKLASAWYSRGGKGSTMAKMERRLNMDPRGGALYVDVPAGQRNPGSTHRKDQSRGAVPRTSRVAKAAVTNQVPKSG